MKDLEALSYNIRYRVWGQKHSQGTISWIHCLQHQGLVDAKRKLLQSGYHPPCVYHLSTWCHRTWPNLPGLPPPYLHTTSDQRQEVGVAWERG